MVETTSCGNFSNSPIIKVVKVLNKQCMACMVVRMSHTSTLRLTYCLPPSNYVGVKYSQMLTQAITTCSPIWSSAIILPNRLLMLEELESRPIIINSIGHKWNGSPKKNSSEMGPSKWKKSRMASSKINEMRDLGLPSKKGFEKRERNDMPPTWIVPLAKITKEFEPPPTLHTLNPKKRTQSLCYGKAKKKTQTHPP